MDQKKGNKPLIPEPQKTYVLELLAALGTAADDFIVVGGQALKFHIEKSRATRDFDFVLDVVGLREQQLELRSILEKELKYSVIEGARNFQFEKAIPNSKERMRIEFMAPSELKRPGKDFRVDVQDSLHARSCTGGSIAIVESDLYTISGHLPNGESCSAKIRVTRPNALIMMKMLALDDRYRNARGPKELQHDREEARVHAADIIAIASAQVPTRSIRDRFEAQFHSDTLLGIEVLSTSDRYFREDISPGFLVYEEYLRANLPVSSASRKELDTETQRAHAVMMDFLPPKQFYDFVLACENSCNVNADAELVKSFLDALEARKISIHQLSALESLPVGTHAVSAGSSSLTLRGAFIWVLPDVAQRYSDFRTRALELMNQPHETILAAHAIALERGAKPVSEILNHPEVGSDAFMEALRMTYAQILAVPVIIENYPMPTKHGSVIDSAIINPLVSARTEEESNYMMGRYRTILARGSNGHLD